MLQASAQLYKNAYSGIPRPVWWLAVVMFVNRCGTMVIPFMTVYLTTRGFTLSQAGYVMGAFGAGSIIGSYLGGKLTDKLGSYRVQVSSLLLNGIMFIVLGQMHTLAQYAVCIFLLSSLGEAFRPANSVAIANYSNEANRIRSYALNRLATNLGWSIGPAVGGLLASVNYNLLFWADGLTCIAASSVLFLFLQPAKEKHKKEVKASVEKNNTSAYSDKPYLKGMFYLFLIALAFFQLFSVIPAYYKNDLHFNEATIGWILAMNGLLIAAFEMVLVYKLEKRNQTLLCMMTGAVLMAFSFLLLKWSNSLTMVVVSMIIVTFGEMFLFPFLNNFWVKRSTESNRGQYASLYMMAWSGATVLAPTLATQVAARAGFSTLWIVDFTCCGLAALGFYFLKKELS